jgi:hypothetical protein
MAGIMSQVLGKDVHIRQITFEAYKTHTRAGHMPASKTSESHARRVALVTGGAHGMGQAIAAGLAERATRIVLGAIDDVSEASDLTPANRPIPVTPPVRERPDRDGQRRSPGCATATQIGRDCARSPAAVRAHIYALIGIRTHGAVTLRFEK